MEDFVRWLVRRYSYATVQRVIRSIKLLVKRFGSFDSLIDRLDEAANWVVDHQGWDVNYKKIILLDLIRLARYAQSPVKELYELYRRLKRPYRIPRIPSYQTALAVLGVIRSKQVRAAYLLALDAGLRQAEIRRLKWSDIDLDKGCITLVEGNKRTEGSILPLSERLLQTLKLLKAYSKGEYVITIHPRCITRSLQIAKRKCISSFPDADLVNLKNLRHLYATMLYNRTRDLALVQRMMRHRLITTTARYIHLTTSRKTYESKAVPSGDKDTILSLLQDGWEMLRELKGWVYFRRLKE